MIGGDFKFVLTCTHTRVPANTHTHTFPSLPKKRLTRQMGVEIKEKEKTHTTHLVSSDFPPVSTGSSLEETIL